RTRLLRSRTASRECSDEPCFAKGGAPMLRFPVLPLWAAILAVNIAAPRVRANDPRVSIACDAYGDPLPDGAVARLGTLRFRGNFRAIAVSPDGKTLASPDGSGVVLWNAVSGERGRAFRGHDGSVSCLAWSPDGRILASGSDDRTIRLWDPTTGKELAQAKGHQGKSAVNDGV